MNGFKLIQTIVVMALLATTSVGCVGSRGGCRKGGCRVLSPAGSVPPRRTETASASHGKVQQMCPVTGEPLGSMGDPIPVTVQGRTIQVCCNGCVAAVKKNPEKYLKIIDQELAQSDTSEVRREAFYARPANTGRVSQSSGSSVSHHH